MHENQDDSGSVLSGSSTDGSIDLLLPENEESSTKRNLVENNISSRERPENNRKRHKCVSENLAEMLQSIFGRTCVDDIPDPIIPQFLSTDSSAVWISSSNNLIIRRDIISSSRTKAAAFDLDNTLLIWRCAHYPSQPHHYELWNDRIIHSFQQLYDKHNYQLVIFSNQGGIRSAIHGKTAERIKGLLNWLANQIQRPLLAVISTSTKSGLHKPNPTMWDICEKECNNGVSFDLKDSFYVGDSDGNDGTWRSDVSKDDEYRSKAVDKLFAENVGKLKGITLRFFHPREIFGQCAFEYRKERESKAIPLSNYKHPPQSTLQTHGALFGGYLEGPIMLILCGAQGSGKSTFAETLIKFNGDTNSSSKIYTSKKNPWIHLSQDGNGSKVKKPGKREEVEKAAFLALSKHTVSVIVDRMHLTPEQRLHFIQIAKKCSVPVHIVLFQPPKKVMEARVRDRVNHPAGVEGNHGVSILHRCWNQLVVPTYEENVDFISIVRNEADVEILSEKYRYCFSSYVTEHMHLPPIRTTTLLRVEKSTDDSKQQDSIPTLTLGTQKVGKRIASSIVSTALKWKIKAVDTAPTYNNEEMIGQGLIPSTFLIVKVPKRAVTPIQVKEEILGSLKKLRLKKANLVLLHWPCEFFEEKTLQKVWEELELLKEDGLCEYLGVSNFSISALQILLPMCKTTCPVVNQVERHPLCPQWKLLDFCRSNSIIMQAHSVLGNGSPKLLNHPTVVRIANETSNSEAQVLMKWNIQQGVPIVTKCTNEKHIKEASSILISNRTTLGPLHMKSLDDIGRDPSSRLRFVAPPFMFVKGAIYSWVDRSNCK